MKQSIGKLIKIAHNALNADLDKLARPHGLTGVQMTIIDFLRTCSAVTQKDIEKEFHIQGSTVTVMIDRLEAKDLVKRYRSEKDKRIKEIKLTDSGTEISEIIKGYIDNHDKLIMSNYSAEEKQVIFKFLESFE
ncbi:MarR family winged helix-turn-helix transcriptional regulator [Liquorilactobacillus hordei]|uniref:Transcriptional regulator n=1 Tax=Liquorilactobacillus hordei TaxID=468911 RepID=A0A3S6QNC7_9LACO|nr:MarR family transcriptional regulator [Liquorilactobacillus hordei]AUJ29481.1 transcriptional regulator [Liquorilactobacillus hordei]